MTSVRLSQVAKIYPNGFEAVKGLDLEISDGELLVVVGPSGCGKTTVLRMIAGLEEVSSGDIYFGEEVVTDVAPRNRDVAMVFQSYALYPQMTVADNIGFALKMKKIPKAEIRQRVVDAADVLGLTEWLDRKPTQLSGGQRQRVAMGRAIVRNPKVFLMDEPLSNLDAKLRVQLRAEIARVQQKIGVATIFVTHDQTEAMTLGHRVAVMRDGALQQCDTPQELYDNPKNAFVAGFIGSPAMNLFEGRLSGSPDTLHIGSQQIQLPPVVLERHPDLLKFVGRTLVVGIRPEDLPASGDDYHGDVLQGDVHLVEALGSELLVHFRIDVEPISIGDSSLVDGSALVEEGSAGSGDFIARVSPRKRVLAGDRLSLAVDPTRIEFFERETGNAIRK
jgi:multiple sugar transport system ATP-binding protein